MTTPGDSSNPWIPALSAELFGEYRLGPCLGKGDFGLVFDATHETTGGVFAVKVLTPTNDPGAVTDFENEGVLLRQLNGCPGVINFVDGGVHPIAVLGPTGIPIPLDVRYHVLTRASGSLEELLRDPVVRSRLSWTVRIELWRWAVKGLMQMHQNGVAHRDLKSGNCLLMVHKSETRIRLADLGRAKDVTLSPAYFAEAYLTGRGDRRFAPPEALFWQGTATRDGYLAADYYGLGSLLVELVTGQSMTSLALGDFRENLELGRQDFLAGRQRDLGTLSLKYRSVIAEIVAELPRSIQPDANAVLASLCHPEPSERLARAPYSRDRASREKLAWILRRADIMIRRLKIEAREERRREERVSA